MGVSVQVGPRSVGRRSAALGKMIARNKFFVAVFVAALVMEAAAIIVGIIMFSGATAPAVYVPAAFCPSGQHVIVTGCAPNH